MNRFKLPEVPKKIYSSTDIAIGSYFLHEGKLHQRIQYQQGGSFYCLNVEKGRFGYEPLSNVTPCSVTGEVTIP